MILCAEVTFHLHVWTMDSAVVGLALAHQLPLQLHWVLPRQAGGAVTHSPVGLIGVDNLVTLYRGDSLLDRWQQALHSQILNTVSTYVTTQILIKTRQTKT